MWQPNPVEMSLSRITATDYGDVFNCLGRWDAAINRFTAEFIKDFCFPDGRIDWEKLVQFVSEDKTSKSARKPQ